MEEYGNASWITNLFCLNKEEILVQFFVNLTQATNPLGLMQISTESGLLIESLDTPQVLFSQLGTDTLYLKTSKLNRITKSVLKRINN